MSEEIAKELLKEARLTRLWQEEGEQSRLRDHFAISIMNGMLASEKWDVYDSRMAEMAYYQADQMLAQRQKL